MANEEIDDPAPGEESFDGDSDGEMPWESEARDAINQALDAAEYDEIRGVVYANRAEEFDSVDEFLSHLIEIGEEQWYAYVPYDDGPVFEPDVDGMAQRLLENHGVVEFFDQIKPPDEGEELGTARELVLPQAGGILRVDLTEINDELIRYLVKRPDLMHELSSRKFEELVAAIFRGKGYDVVLTPATRDGGFDMRAFQRTDIGTFLTLIECKRYAPSNRVTVDVVRGLYGVTETEKATSGLLVTTSSFTKDAKSFQDKNRFRLQLADNQALQGWLKEHKKR
jgi:hypothetical protein